MVLEAQESGELYQLSIIINWSPKALMSERVSEKLWHYRSGHLNYPGVFLIRKKEDPSWIGKNNCHHLNHRAVMSLIGNFFLLNVVEKVMDCSCMIGDPKLKFKKKNYLSSSS